MNDQGITCPGCHRQLTSRWLDRHINRCFGKTHRSSKGSLGVGPFDTKNVTVKWGTGASATSASYFGDGVFTSTRDPQCGAVTAAQNLSTFCTLNAIVDTRTSQIVLQNPQPGTRGTLGQRAVYLPGTWRFDANLRKAFTLAESKTLEFRIDASDILNHAEPGTPTLSIINANFGQIPGNAAKSSLHRQFQAQMRFNF